VWPSRVSHRQESDRDRVTLTLQERVTDYAGRCDLALYGAFDWCLMDLTLAALHSYAVPVCPSGSMLADCMCHSVAEEAVCT
jgi:hypothetical protein